MVVPFTEIGNRREEEGFVMMGSDWDVLGLRCLWET